MTLVSLTTLHSPKTKALSIEYILIKLFNAVWLYIFNSSGLPDFISIGNTPLLYSTIKSTSPCFFEL